LSPDIGAFCSAPYFDHTSIYYVERETNIYFHWLNHLHVMFGTSSDTGHLHNKSRSCSELRSRAPSQHCRLDTHQYSFRKSIRYRSASRRHQARRTRTTPLSHRRFPSARSLSKPDSSTGVYVCVCVCPRLLPACSRVDS
jgi:hypothetical protein